jgi:hypothetical protein
MISAFWEANGSSEKHFICHSLVRYRFQKTQHLRYLSIPDKSPPIFGVNFYIFCRVRPDSEAVSFV